MKLVAVLPYVSFIFEHVLTCIADIELDVVLLGVVFLILLCSEACATIFTPHFLWLAFIVPGFTRGSTICLDMLSLFRRWGTRVIKLRVHWTLTFPFFLDLRIGSCIMYA